VYPLAWNGAAADGTPEPEGDWRFSVTAVDDRGESSTADRLFSLNRTLAALDVPPTFQVGAGSQLRVGFTLSRPASVTVAVETASGAVLATPVNRESREAGANTVAWDGRVGNALAHAGRFVLRVTATNEVGSASLAAPLTVRRSARG
jgi:hypothetical protein